MANSVFIGGLRDPLQSGSDGRERYAVDVPIVRIVMSDFQDVYGA